MCIQEYVRKKPAGWDGVHLFEGYWVLLSKPTSRDRKASALAIRSDWTIKAFGEEDYLVWQMSSLEITYAGSLPYIFRLLV